MHSLGLQVKNPISDAVVARARKQQKLKEAVFQKQLFRSRQAYKMKL
jgi:hypothetical protein